MPGQPNTDINDTASTSLDTSNIASTAHSSSTSIEPATSAAHDSDTSTDNSASPETDGYVDPRDRTNDFFIDDELNESEKLAIGETTLPDQFNSSNRISSTPVGSPIKSHNSVEHLVQFFNDNSPQIRSTSDANLSTRVTRS